MLMLPMRFIDTLPVFAADADAADYAAASDDAAAAMLMPDAAALHAAMPRVDDAYAFRRHYFRQRYFRARRRCADSAMMLLIMPMRAAADI